MKLLAEEERALGWASEDPKSSLGSARLACETLDEAWPFSGSQTPPPESKELNQMILLSCDLL